MLDTVLCVDIGTTSLKAGLITADGEVVSFSKYRFFSPSDRFVANRWIKGLRSCVRKMIKTNPKVMIRAVSISGNGPTLVSENGKTLRWNEEYKVDKERSGNSLFIPRIIAFKEMFPVEFKCTKKLYSGPEFLIYKLTGESVTVLPDSRYVTAYWDEERLKSSAVDVDPSKMPEMKGIGECLGNVSREIVELLGIELNVMWDQPLSDRLPILPVYSCGPDFTAALVGTNTLNPGKLCDRSGSSEGFNFCIEKPVSAEGLRLLPSVIPGLWNISALITSSSKLSPEQRLKIVAPKVESLRGFSAENGIEFPDCMTVTGGQTCDSDWMKLKAKTLRMKLKVCECSDSELLGDAAAAWFGLGKYKSLQEAAENIVKEETSYGNV
ncbi:MAG: hypothetical protein MJ162_08655 [Treponema sp.]|nr:hypothetical protein [Treponema sp.]